MSKKKRKKNNQHAGTYWVYYLQGKRKIWVKL